MNTDIRLSVGFWKNHKTKKLERRLGLEGVKSLQILWLWAATDCSSGVLSGMTAEDIELDAEWSGEPGKFVDTLVDLHWLDKNGDTYALHDWAENNEWVAGAEDRSDKSRFTKLAQVDKKLFSELKEKGINAISAEEYQRLTAGRRLEQSETPASSTATASEGQSAKPADSSASRQHNAERDASVTHSPFPYPSSPNLTLPKDKNTPLSPPEGGPCGQGAGASPEAQEGATHPASKAPLEGVPYDTQAFKVITEMYELCPEYIPDPPSEIRLVQDLGQEYPGVPLFAQFRKARDWLENHPKKRKKDLKAFLRNWISNAVNRYGETGQRLVGYENVVTFAPITGGGTTNGGTGTDVA